MPLLQLARSRSSLEVEPQMQSIQYSPEAQMALANGNFDARKFFKKPRETGNEEEDEEQRSYFRNKVKIMDMLCQKPKIISSVLSTVENKYLGVSTGAKTAAAQREQTRWPNTYQYMEKIPKYYRGEFLAKALAEHGVKPEWLTKLDAACPSAINELFDFCLALHPKTHIPRALLEKSVMEGFFLERIKDVGRATKEKVQDICCKFKEPARLDWSHGCFQLKKTGAKIKIVHITSDEADWPDYIKLTTDVEMVNNFWDQHAAVKLGEDTTDCENCAKRFKKGSGPKQPRFQDTDGHMKTAADYYFKRVTEAREKEENKQAASAPLSDGLEANDKQRKRAMAAKALAKREPKKLRVAAGALING